MSEDLSQTGHIKIMASIGAVCLQWALLEHLLLGWISAIEKMPVDKTYIMFGSVDLRGRLGIALQLARDERLPGSYIARMTAIRTAINGGLLDRRNQAVHGVHASAGIDDAVQLTIAKWQGDKRHEVVTVMDFHDLITRLTALVREADAIMNDIMDWRIRVAQKRVDKLESELATRDAGVLFKLAENIKTRFKRRGGQS